MAGQNQNSQTASSVATPGLDEQPKDPILHRDQATSRNKGEILALDGLDFNPAMRSVLRTPKAGMFTCRDMVFSEVSQEILDMLGYQSQRLVGRLGPLELVASEDWERLYRYLTSDLDSDQEPHSYKFVRADNTVLICWFAAQYWKPKGKVCLVGAMAPWERRGAGNGDASSLGLEELAQAETACIQCDPQAFYSKIFLNLPDPTIVHDQKGRIVDANQAALNTLGYSLDEIRKLKLSDVLKIDPVGLEAWLTPAQGSECNKGTMILADGKSVPVSMRYRALHGYDGPIIVTSFNDATSLCEHEEKLRQSNLEKTLILNSIRELVAYQDRSHTVVWANKAAGDSVNKHPAELAGRKCYEIWHQSNTICPGCPVDETFKDGTYHQNEITTPDGRVWLIKSNPVLDEKGQPIGAVETTLEITEQKRAEQEQKRTEAELRLLNKVASAFLTVPGDSAYQLVLDHVLEATASMWGLLAYVADDRGLVIAARKGNQLETLESFESQPLERALEDLFGKIPASKPIVVSNSRSAEARGFLNSKRCLLAQILDDRKPIGFLVLADKPLDYNEFDTHLIERVCVTIAPILRARLDKEKEERRAQRIKKEKEEVQRRLLVAQKMEAVGRLAGGIAHDFNNILSSIRGYCDLVMMRLDPDSVFYKDLKQIQDAISRATSLCRQLLLFGKQQPMEIASVNLNSLVQGVSEMVARLLGENISLTLSLEPDIMMIKGDRSQIEQVILNLILNARDAMPNGGTIRVTTQNYVHDGSTDKNGFSGKMVCLSVSDEGVGIPADQIDRIFDPFYTTKKVTSGTGLGLSIVQSIVERHRGWTTVSSQVNKGTTFRVYFPTDGELVDEQQYHQSDVTNLRGNKEKVLVVEDEEQVRNLVCRALRENNYTVFEAGSAGEALKVFEERKGDIDLLLSDVVLSDKSGVDLAKKLHSLSKSLSIVMMSGYADGKCEWPRIQHLGFRFLHKPFGIADLLRSVKASLVKTSKRSA